MAAQISLRAFPDMDDATARLILQLQLQDSEELAAKAKGKGRVGQLTDSELALQLYKTHLETNVSLLRDHEIAAQLDPGARETSRELQLAARRRPLMRAPTVRIHPIVNTPPTSHNFQLPVQDSKQLPVVAVPPSPSSKSSHSSSFGGLITPIESTTKMSPVTSSGDEDSTVSPLELPLDLDESSSSALPTVANLSVPRDSGRGAFTISALAKTVGFLTSMFIKHPSGYKKQQLHNTPDLVTEQKVVEESSGCDASTNTGSDNQSHYALDSNSVEEVVADTSNCTSIGNTNKGKQPLETVDSESEDKVVVKLSAETPSRNPTKGKQPLAILDFDFDDEVVAESSAWAASRKPKEIKVVACVSCAENIPIFDIVQAPCEHNYCRDCLQQLFHLSEKDDSLFPPRCCGKIISAQQFREFLTPELLKNHEDKKAEFDTPDKTYCSACFVFLKPESIVAGLATCACGKITCAMCKNPQHEGDCPADEELNRVLELAKKQGWQRCNSCKTMVGIADGCNHMRCRCGAVWCYLCGKSWKTCECPQFTEEQLVERVNVIAGRQAARNGGVQRQNRTAIRRRLREHCDHNGLWQYDHGAGICENCSDKMPIFTMGCSRCYTQWCKRCTLNRV